MVGGSAWADSSEGRCETNASETPPRWRKRDSNFRSLLRRSPGRSADRQRVRRHRHAATRGRQVVTDSSIVGSSRTKLGPPEPAPHADLELESRGMLWRCPAWLF